jgi:hypothetical protein
MTQLWSHRQGFRPALKEEFWTAFYTALRSRLVPDYLPFWEPYYQKGYREDFREGNAESFMKEHIGDSIRLFYTDVYERQTNNSRVLDYVEVFYLMAHDQLRQVYADEVNTLFRRYNQPFELIQGKVHRRGSESLEEPLERLEDLRIRDKQILRYLHTAREAFFDAREDRRLEGLRSLWDAFERLKSLGDPVSDTTVSIG